MANSDQIEMAKNPINFSSIGENKSLSKQNLQAGQKIYLTSDEKLCSNRELLMSIGKVIESKDNLKSQEVAPILTELSPKNELLSKEKSRLQVECFHLHSTINGNVLVTQEEAEKAKLKETASSSNIEDKLPYLKEQNYAVKTLAKKSFSEVGLLDYVNHSLPHFYSKACFTLSESLSKRNAKG